MQNLQESCKIILVQVTYTIVIFVDRQVDRQTDRYIERQTDIQIDKQADDRYIDRLTGRLIDDRYKAWIDKLDRG